MNGEIFGFAGILINVDIVEIMNIVVRKKYRHKGIGQELLGKLIDLAKETKLQYLILEVNSENLPAINLYEKFGFETIRNKEKIL